VGATTSQSPFVIPLLQAQLLVALEQEQLADSGPALLAHYRNLYRPTQGVLDAVELLEVFVATWLGRVDGPADLDALRPRAREHQHLAWLAEAHGLRAEWDRTRLVVDQLDRGGWSREAVVELLRAEVLAAEGSVELAREVARRAWELSLSGASTDLMLRAHLARHARRIIALEQAHGGIVSAATVEAQLWEWRDAH
jgi:hypothetical protein